MVSATLSISALRTLVGVSNFIIWASSAIVVGITGYFLNEWHHDQHLIFEIVISALTLAFWLPSFLFPFLGTYKYFYGPANFIFSYLWLTSFIFAAQDYNESSCGDNAPTGGSCNLKLTSEAFIFLALSWTWVDFCPSFFTLVASVADVRAWKSAAVAAAGPVHPEKDIRPSAGATV